MESIRTSLSPDIKVLKRDALTPNEIRRRAAEIRKNWSRDEQLQRIFAAQQQQWTLWAVQQPREKPCFVFDN